MNEVANALGFRWPTLPAAPRFTADFLEVALGRSWADNTAGLKDTSNWLSDFNGTCLKNMINLSNQQAQMFAPFGVPQETFTWWMKPLVAATREAVEAGRDPDLVAVDNLRVESAYADALKELVAACTTETEATEEDLSGHAVNITRARRKVVFNRAFCESLCSEWGGQMWLLGKLAGLQQLEWQHHSIGQTRMTAMKELLRSLMQVIAGEVFSERAAQPFRKPGKEGSDEHYLHDCEMRLLALLALDAFDVRRFALESPHARLGACAWEEVPGSQLYTVRLRHYPLPEGIKPNGKTLYMSTPMINRCEIFDLAPGKSVVEGMLALGYDLYMVDYGNPGPEQHDLTLDFYGKTVHDKYMDMLIERHPGQEIEVMAYCMGGTLILPYLARRAQEACIEGHPFEVRQVVLLTTPVLFDDENSGHKPMRDIIRKHYDPAVMNSFFGECNVPPQTIELGMHGIQPGVSYSVAEGFYARASYPGAIDDAAPFLHWLHQGTRFAAHAHQEWIQRIVLGNELWEGRYCLPSKYPQLDGQPVDMTALERADVSIFDYRGQRDPIAPVGSCKSSERWGRRGENQQMTGAGMNRTLEKNIGHIFVVSKTLLGDFLHSVQEFLHDAPPPYQVVRSCGEPMQPMEAEEEARPKPARRSRRKPAADSE